MGKRNPATSHAQKMLDDICESVHQALLEGECEVDVVISRKILRADGLSEPEFILVHGFQCGDDDCPKVDRIHVRVFSSAPEYEYPEHLEHREPA